MIFGHLFTGFTDDIYFDCEGFKGGFGARPYLQKSQENVLLILIDYF